MAVLPLGTIAFAIGCGSGKPAKPVRPPGSMVVQPPVAAPAAPVVVTQFPVPVSNEPEEAEALPGPDDFEIIPEQEAAQVGNRR